MKELRIHQIAQAVGGKADFDGVVRSVCTDTRALERDCLFVAIKGERFDSHDFTAQALANGAAAVMVERPTGCDREILVDDTRLAQLRLAGDYRRLFDIPVVGVTGSVGKTTIKEMTALVLSKKYNTLRNQGNLNNDIGLPKTIFRLDDSYTAAVLEMGMNHAGEITHLTAAAAPDVGVIGNIGVSHMENLGSRENILKAKLEILNGMQPGAPLVLNGDDPYLAGVRLDDHPVYFYGIEQKDCAFRAENLQSRTDGYTFDLVCACGRQEIFLPAPGKHNVYNALAACSVGVLLGVSLSDAAAALASYVPEGMRQRIRRVGDITLIEDCYNASPDSMRAALAMLKDFPATRRIAVLGDMLELGEISEQAHRDVGALCAKRGVDLLMTYGTRAADTAKGAKENGLSDVRHYDDKDALADDLLHLLRAGDAVIVKASRGMRMEDILKRIYEDYKS